MTFLLLNEIVDASPKKRETQKSLEILSLLGHLIFIDVRVDVRNKYIVAVSEPIYFIPHISAVPRHSARFLVESNHF